jgi:hypothetical protein
VPLHRILQLAVFVSFSFTRTSTRQLNVEIQGTMPAILTLHFCSTWNQSGYCAPLLATMRLYRILQLAVFDCCPIARTSIRPADAGIQDILPSTTTLTFCSTRNQLGNFIPIFATVRLHCTHQLAVFVLCPIARTSIRPADAGIQDTMPSVTTLIFRSTWYQCGNCTPILVTVHLYRILQLAVFVFCSFTRTSRRPVDARIQALMPSAITLTFRSTRNQRGNCTPILATVRLYRILQLTVFFWCPFTCTSIRSADAEVQGKSRKGKALEEIAMLAIIKRDRIATRKGTSVSGANSDPSYHERLNFESLAAAGLSVDYTLAVEGANAGPKLLSTRKPLLPSTGGSAAAPG